MWGTCVMPMRWRFPVVSDVGSKSPELWRLTPDLFCWMSRLQLSDIAKDSTTRFNVSGNAMNGFKFVGHEQVEVYDAKDQEFLIDCMVLSDGTNKICYLNDPLNPLIIKFESDKNSFVLVKIE